jgi:serine/threonine protein kinase
MKGTNEVRKCYFKISRYQYQWYQNCRVSICFTSLLRPFTVMPNVHILQIGDFGLAKKELFEDSSTPTSPTEFTPPKCSSQMTSTNHPTLQRKPSQHTSGVGTQAYAAPEQLTKGQVITLRNWGCKHATVGIRNPDAEIRTKSENRTFSVPVLGWL